MGNNNTIGLMFPCINWSRIGSSSISEQMKRAVATIKEWITRVHDCCPTWGTNAIEICKSGNPEKEKKSLSLVPCTYSSTHDWIKRLHTRTRRKRSNIDQLFIMDKIITFINFLRFNYTLIFNVLVQFETYYRRYVWERNCTWSLKLSKSYLTKIVNI